MSCPGDLYHGEFPVDMTPNEARAEVLRLMRKVQPFVPSARTDTVRCPRCEEQCGWCSDPRRMHGQLNLPGLRKKCTISGFEPEGDQCPMCGGAGSVMRTVSYERIPA